MVILQRKTLEIAKIVRFNAGYIIWVWQLRWKILRLYSVIAKFISTDRVYIVLLTHCTIVQR